MRFQAVLLVSIALCLATSNAFFLKKAKVLPATLGAVKRDLVADATAAVVNLKEAGHLKVKALTGGIKAIGTAKLGVLKGIKDAKVGAVKAVVDTKIAKVAAVKASKVTLAKTLLNGKLGAFAATGAHFGVSSGISGSSTSSSSSGSSGNFGNLGGATSASASSASLSNFGTVLQFVGDDKLTLYPPANAAPTHINIITYKNSESSSGQSLGAGNNNGYAPKPTVVPAPLTSYGTPIRPIPPSTSYGLPILR